MKRHALALVLVLVAGCGAEVDVYDEPGCVADAGARDPHSCLPTGRRRDGG